MRGGTLRVGMPTGGNAETLDPRKAISNPDLSRCYALYDTLFQSVAGGKYAPALAEEATPNADATLWTIRLRQGVTWHDGKPFTADDVVYTIKSSWGSTDNSINPGLAPFINFAEARKLDDRTVQVPLNRGLAEFPKICTQCAMSIVQDGTTDYTKAVGTGPFVLQSFTPGKQSTFTANRNYWRSGTPYVDQLVIDSSFAALDAQLNALLAGNIDIAPQMSQALAAGNARAGRIVLGVQPGPGFLAPTMRMDTPPFNNPQVRQALRLLADRKAGLTQALNGFGSVGNDVPGQTLEYWATDLQRSPDPARAKAMLQSANQENLDLTLYTADLVGGMNSLAVAFAQQASAAGVKVNVQNVDAATYYSPGSPGGAYPNKPFSMNQWANGMPCLSFVYLTNALPGAPYNETGWGGPDVDKLLYDAMGELDPAKAGDKWRAVQEKQFNDGGYIIMNNLDFVDGYSPKVRGAQTSSAGPCDNYNFSGAWLAR